MLLAAGADPNTFFINPPDKVKESALYGAAGVARNPAITQLLLTAGAQVNDGESLYHATESNDTRCLELLLTHNPPPESISACMFHKMDFEDLPGLKLFLKHGADPNIESPYGRQGFRPLHWAILRNRSLNIIKALLAAGADATLPTKSGLTPYAHARKSGRTDIATLLLTRIIHGVV